VFAPEAFQQPLGQETRVFLEADRRGTVARIATRQL